MTASTIMDIIAPQFATNPDKDSFIEIATSLTASCYFGDQYELAIALRASHMMSVLNRPGGSSGAAGKLASLKEGDSAISYNTAGASAGSLSSTSYGQALETLINNGGGGISITGLTLESNETSC